MELHVTFPVKIIPGKDFHEHLCPGLPDRGFGQTQATPLSLIRLDELLSVRSTRVLIRPMFRLSRAFIGEATP
jgi:hypothetical protein